MSQELIRFVEVTLRALIGGALIVSVIIIKLIKRIFADVGQNDDADSSSDDTSDGSSLD